MTTYTDEQMEAMLNLKWYCDDLYKEVSIKEYFYELLNKLWEEDEGFSGKRPFGNSGWYLDLAIPLVKNGYVKGTYYEEDGYPEIENYDRKEYYSLVSSLILYALLKENDTNL